MDSASGASDARKVAQVQQRYPDAPVSLIHQLLAVAQGDTDLVETLLSTYGAMDDGDDEGDDDEDDDDGDGEEGEQPASPASDASVRSVVELHGSGASSCGYCHTTGSGRTSFGFTSPRMRCDDYAALMDRGWRRCGDYYYKTDNAACCCPNYTIRLDVHHFAISKAQRKALRRMDDFLAGRRTEHSKTVHAPQDQGKAGEEEGTRAKDDHKAPEDEEQARIRSVLLAAVAQLQSNGALPTQLTQVSAQPHAASGHSTASAFYADRSA